ncbi:MAG: DUF4157 domain-containing protein, partial [Thalassolituus sp.]
EEEEAQTKLYREEEEEAAQTKLMRAEEEEAQTKLFREKKEEAAQPKLFRAEEEEAQTKLFREEEEEAAQPKLRRTKEQEDAESNDKKLDEVEARIAQTRGNGQPMENEIRQKMEQQFGKDFSGVVVHSDMQADELCKELNARAFAIGNDIYFASGEYNPESERGQELLAHELTHVVQQSRGINRKVYRAAANPARAADPTARAVQKGATLATDGTLSHPQAGTMNRSNHTISLPSIDLPAVKKPFTPQPCEIPAGRTRDDTQATVWDNAVQQASIDTKLGELIAPAPDMQINGSPAFYLKLKKENQ